MTQNDIGQHIRLTSCRSRICQKDHTHAANSPTTGIRDHARAGRRRAGVEPRSLLRRPAAAGPAGGRLATAGSPNSQCHRRAHARCPDRSPADRGRSGHRTGLANPHGSGRTSATWRFPCWHSERTRMSRRYGAPRWAARRGSYPTAISTPIRCASFPATRYRRQNRLRLAPVHRDKTTVAGNAMP